MRTERIVWFSREIYDAARVISNLRLQKDDAAVLLRCVAIKLGVSLDGGFQHGDQIAATLTPPHPPVPKVPWYKRALEALNQAAGTIFSNRK